MDLELPLRVVPLPQPQPFWHPLIAEHHHHWESSHFITKTLCKIFPRPNFPQTRPNHPPYPTPGSLSHPPHPTHPPGRSIYIISIRDLDFLFSSFLSLSRFLSYFSFSHTSLSISLFLSLSLSVSLSLFLWSYLFFPRFRQCQNLSDFSSVCLSVCMYVRELLRDHWAHSLHFGWEYSAYTPI